MNTGTIDTGKSLSIIIFLAPVLFVYIRKNYFSGGDGNKDGTGASVNGANLVLENNVYFQNACTRFNVHYELHYSSSRSDMLAEYQHQVAGHTNEALRVLDGGLLLKPMIKKDLFLREVALYEEMNSQHAAYVATPVAFVPKYYGVMCLKTESGNNLPHLVLHDVNYSYKKPCVMDIKMGQQTFEPNATQEKKDRERRKYPHQEEVGFRITGFKVYDIVSQTFVGFDKNLGRSLLPHFVKDCLSSFFFNGLFMRREVILTLMQQLQCILRWMKRQDRYHFYCSSLLIVYDGELLKDNTAKNFLVREGLRTNPCRHFLNRAREKEVSSVVVDEIEENYKHYLRTHSTCFVPLSTNPHDVVQVKIIDLAHTVMVAGDTNQGVDVGYIHGLEVLITTLEDIVTLLDNAGEVKFDVVGNLTRMFHTDSLQGIQPVPGL